VAYLCHSREHYVLFVRLQELCTGPTRHQRSIQPSANTAPFEVPKPKTDRKRTQARSSILSANTNIRDSR